MGFPGPARDSFLPLALLSVARGAGNLKEGSPRSSKLLLKHLSSSQESHVSSHSLGLDHLMMTCGHFPLFQSSLRSASWRGGSKCAGVCACRTAPWRAPLQLPLLLFGFDQQLPSEVHLARGALVSPGRATQRCPGAAVQPAGLTREGPGKWQDMSCSRMELSKGAGAAPCLSVPEPTEMIFLLKEKGC